MGKIRRGGFVFLCWRGDHGPKHVHVYRNGRLVVKWDVEAEQPMKGMMTRRIRQILRQLQSEGLL
jgi:cell wall-associated NlpC family hydrolase